MVLHVPSDVDMSPHHSVPYVVSSPSEMSDCCSRMVCVDLCQIHSVCVGYNGTCPTDGFVMVFGHQWSSKAHGNRVYQALRSTQYIVSPHAEILLQGNQT